MSERNYPQIISALKEHPWLIRESALETILLILDRRVSGEKLSQEEIEHAISQRRSERDSVPESAQGVGILPLYGPIFPKANLFTEFSGGTSIEEFQQQFRAMLQNDQVKSILMDVDSPGGSAYMIPEMADEIYRARKVKPVIAVANPESASAALFIASQSKEFYSTPSGFVGSLGTVVVHDDISEMQSKMGIKTTYITAGKYKREGAPEFPLSEETRDYIQGVVDEVNDTFVKSVARGRGTSVDDVAANYGEGRMLTAKRAQKVGMIDGLATFDEVLGDLLSNGGKPKSGTKQVRLGASYDRELEHSEPGSGLGEPLPRIPPEDEDIDEWDKGERFDDPMQEGSMDREALIAFVTQLGLSADKAADMKNEELVEWMQTHLTNLLEQQSELMDAVSTAQAQRAFADAYPEQAARLDELEKKGRKADASEFASSFSRLKDSDGKETKFGLSIPIREKIEDAHIRLSESTFTPDDLAELINMLASEHAVVEFGEQGSNRVREDAESIKVPETRHEARQLFADKVKELMTEDSLDRKAALAEAAKRYPELAEAYATK